MLATSNQAYVFLSTVYAGFVIGFIYDCYRMVRKILKTGRFLTGLLDLSFWMLIGVLSYLVIFLVNDGEVRIYTIAGFAIGWALYALVLSLYVMKVMQFIYDTIVKIIMTILHIILWPFQKIIKIISPPLHFLNTCFKKGLLAGKKRCSALFQKKTDKRLQG